MSLILKNPHSVLAVLETRPKDVIEVIIPPKNRTDAWDLVEQHAKNHKIPIRGASTVRLPEPKAARGGRGIPDESQRTGLASATVKERSSLAVEELFKGARERKEGRGLWLALDSLQDPHNVGAIFRAAGFFGVEGILITQERSAPLTGVVYDVASGGVEHVPFSMQVNLQQAFEKAKEAGLWILGSSEHAPEDYQSVPVDRPWLLVLGNEEKGMRRLTEEACDVLCRVPAQGKVTSLNVSVAAGVLISRFTSPTQ